MDRRAEWRTWSTLIFWGVVALTVFGWIAGFLELFSGIANTLQGIMNNISQFGMMSNLDAIQEYLDGFRSLLTTTEFLTLAGWVTYLLGLYRFRDGQTSRNAVNAVRRVNNACWVGIISVAISFIASLSPWIISLFFSFIAWIIATISYFMFRSAFRDLETQPAWNEKAQQGARLLRKSANFNIWLQFMPLIIFLIALVLVFTTYQSVMSSSGLGFQEYIGLYIFLGVIIGLTLFILSLLQLIYRIWGWNRVMRGEPVEVADFSYFAPASPSSNGFCPHCGKPLTINARFCQECGCEISSLQISQPQETPADTPTHVAEENIAAKNVEIMDVVEEAPEPPMEEDYYVENPSTWEKYKWYFIGGGALLITVLVLFFSLGRDTEKEIGKKYVYTESTTLFRILDGELGEDPVKELNFGEEVSVLGEDSIWIKVSVDDNKGYVAFSDLMDWEDFNPVRRLLNTDENIRSTAYTRNHRKAISAEFKDRNTVNLEALGYHDSFEDGYYQNVTMIANDSNNGIREYIIYGFSDEDAVPVRLHSEIIPEGMTDVKDAVYKNGKYKISYNREKSSTQRLQGADVFTGYIDGKYEIVMNLLNYGSHFKGIYYYTKNESPIELEGDMDEDRQLTLNETVNGTVTGQFMGEFNDYEYAGYWISPDGERSLIFKVNKE